MTISQDQVRDRRLPAFLGQAYAANHNDEEIDFSNADPQAVQITTIEVSSSADSTAYQFEVNAVPVKFTTPGSSNTTTTIAAALAAELNENPLLRRNVVATSAAAVITLTGTNPGLAFTVTESDSRIDAPSTTQAAAESAAIPFARLCIAAGASSQDVYANRLGRLASSTGLTARVVTLTTEAVAATIPTHISIEAEGQIYNISHVGTGGGDTANALATALRLAINELAGLSDIVTASGATDKVIITSDVAGVHFEILSLGTSLTSAVTAEGDDINKLALGVSLRCYDESETSYSPASVVAAKKRGGVWVEASAAVEGEPVYVHLDGANAGKLYPSGGANRALLKNASWFKDRSSSGLAVVNCNF